MSSGPYRGKRAGRLARRESASSRKPRREGLSFVPPAALEVLVEVLSEMGLEGLIIWCVVFNLKAKSLNSATIDGGELKVFDANRERVFQLQAEESKSLRSLIQRVHANTKTADSRHVSNDIPRLLHQKVQPEVRKRLARRGELWSEQVNISIRTLRRTGAALIAEKYGEHLEYLRAYLRSVNANADMFWSTPTESVAKVYSDAVAPFWELVRDNLSEDARKGIARLEQRDQTQSGDSEV